MKKIHDLTTLYDVTYKLAKIIDEGNYANIVYYEFFKEIDPKGIHNWESGLDAFGEYSNEFNDVFLLINSISSNPFLVFRSS